VQAASAAAAKAALLQEEADKVALQTAKNASKLEDQLRAAKAENEVLVTQSEEASARVAAAQAARDRAVKEVRVASMHVPHSLSSAYMLCARCSRQSNGLVCLAIPSIVSFDCDTLVLWACQSVSCILHSQETGGARDVAVSDIRVSVASSHLK